MAQITSARSRRPQPSGDGSGPSASSPVTRRAALRTELLRQRARLLNRSTGSLVYGPGAEGCADPADQASTDREQDLAIQTKSRVVEMLREIDRALRLLEMPGYGRCRRCGKGIPFKRLQVKPDALFCVPCLTLMEERTR